MVSCTNKLQSNFNGSNIFGTIEYCSRHGYFEPMRLIMVPGQEVNGDNLGFFSDFLHNNCMLNALIRIASMMRF